MTFAVVDLSTLQIEIQILICPRWRIGLQERIQQYNTYKDEQEKQANRSKRFDHNI